MCKKLIFGILMMLTLCIPSFAQNVVRKGNNFETVQRSTKQTETKTQYTYTDSKGVVYPVYLSSTGKAFIKKTSKKSGKEYKQYLPEIGKQINPKAYEKDNKPKNN